MQRFSQLFRELDATTRTSEKLEALERYFRSAPEADAAWVLYFLMGRRGKRSIKTSLMRDWVADESGYPSWLVDECYDTVGDLAETLSLLMEGRHPCRPVQGDGHEWESGSYDRQSPPFHKLIETHLLPLSQLPETRQRELFIQTLRSLDRTGRFIWLKLLTGGFRIGVSRTLVVRALALSAGLPRAVMEHRLMSAWEPRADDFRRLMDSDESEQDPAQPYPFYLASPIEQNVEPIESLEHWQAEWKWDGIRAQLIRREDQTILWSRGEEVITPGYPEIQDSAGALENGTVIDGELLAWTGERPLPFNALQKRLGRKSVSRKLQREVPVVFMAYDLLEHQGKDLRGQTMSERRQRLEETVGHAELRFKRLIREEDPSSNEVQGELFQEEAFSSSDPGSDRLFAIKVSPLVEAGSMEALSRLKDESRGRAAEGIMLKRKDSVYGVGRQRGAWWKWKVDPFTVDAVLIAAQPGHGKRAGLFTDYTFGIWNGDELQSFAKAYSGLTDEEIEEVDRWVRGHTTGRHGPVRTVKPELVFELAFEGIQESRRHKSGVALRFPRILRRRDDKKMEEADRLEELRKLLAL